MVPPYTMMAGRFKRPMAIITPGIFLSQPGREMLPSYLVPGNNIRTKVGTHIKVIGSRVRTLSCDVVVIGNSAG